MAVYQLNPLDDPRWSDFLQGHPKASAFHTPGWLCALRQTYGYEPFVITTTPPEQPLANGVVLCRVKSWLTGSRIVSVPFSDHCELLTDYHQDLLELLEYLRGMIKRERINYCELRPKGSLDLGRSCNGQLGGSETFFLHTLSLQPSLEVLFRRCHKSCIQRKVQRAAREELTIDAGASDCHLKAFYKLLLLTRRRHQLPPQPFSWFHNLTRSCGDSVLIRVALKNSQPIASILTMSYKKTTFYKYGCSDASLHSLGAMPFLLWDAIREAKERGATDFDFGRSEPDNAGLIAFKDNWGGTRTELTYYRYPAEISRTRTNHGRMAAARRVVSALPDVCVAALGRLMYRHIG
jgi:hypothetical protein